MITRRENYNRGTPSFRTRHFVIPGLVRNLPQCGRWNAECALDPIGISGTRVPNKRLHPQEELVPVHQPEDGQEDEAVGQGDERGVPGECGKAVEEGFGDGGEVKGLAHGIGRDGVHSV